ncbi:hypothetical protein M5K25_007581 [Dendrobium thyrsiflorum]|uniref:Uncharacterized protein n=1 Tax=Dendrobium thyrsiflorum TaxID=117978 RepID=A0ABD0VFW7_DENTH
MKTGIHERAGAESRPTDRGEHKAQETERRASISNGCSASQKEGSSKNLIRSILRKERSSEIVGIDLPFLTVQIGSLKEKAVMGLPLFVQKWKNISFLTKENFAHPSFLICIVIFRERKRKMEMFGEEKGGLGHDMEDNVAVINNVRGTNDTARMGRVGGRGEQKATNIRSASMS